MTTDPITDAARVLGAHEEGMYLPDGVAPDDYDGNDHWECECGHDYGVHDDGAFGIVRELVATHKAQMLAEAGLLAAPDLRQVGPRLGASACDDDGISVCPKMAYSNKRIGRERDQLLAQVGAVRDLLDIKDTYGHDEFGAFKRDLTKALDDPQASRQDAPQPPADPPAGVERGQDGSGAVRGADA